MRMIIIYVCLILFSYFNTLASDLVIYSARKQQLIQPLLDAYKKETGVSVKTHIDSGSSLIHRLDLEVKKKTPFADLFMSIDIGHLYLAQKKSLLQPVFSSQFKNVPSAFKSSKGFWYGFSLRMRTLFYNPKKVSLKFLSSYKDLSHKRWRKKLCLRTSKKVYNQSLVASLILHHGFKKVESILKGWVSNLKYPVFFSDTRLLEAVYKGRCDIAVANSYYYYRLLRKNKKLSQNVKILWANQKTSGVHVNISGFGLVRYSKNKKKAINFMKWMLTKGQSLIQKTSDEFPVSKKLHFKTDKTSLEKIGSYQLKAIKLMNRVGYK